MTLNDSAQSLTRVTMSSSTRVTGLRDMWLMSIITSLRKVLSVTHEALIAVLVYNLSTSSGKEAAKSWQRPPPIEWPTRLTVLTPCVKISLGKSHCYPSF